MRARAAGLTFLLLDGGLSGCVRQWEPRYLVSLIQRHQQRDNFYYKHREQHKTGSGGDACCAEPSRKKIPC